MDLLLDLSEKVKAGAITLAQAQARVDRNRNLFKPLDELARIDIREMGTKRMTENDPIFIMFNVKTTQVAYIPHVLGFKILPGFLELIRPPPSLHAGIRAIVRGKYMTIRQIMIRLSSDFDMKPDRKEVETLINEEMVKNRILRKKGRMYRGFSIHAWILPKAEVWLRDTITYGTLRQVELLLKLKIPVVVDDFIAAVRTNQPALAEKLAQIANLSEDWIKYGLEEAILYDNMDVYDLFEEKNVLLNDLELGQLLPSAAGIGNIEVVKNLVEEFDVDPHYDNDAALKEAEIGGFRDIVEYLSSF